MSFRTSPGRPTWRRTAACLTGCGRRRRRCSMLCSVVQVVESIVLSRTGMTASQGS